MSSASPYQVPKNTRKPPGGVCSLFTNPNNVQPQWETTFLVEASQHPQEQPQAASGP